MKNKKILVLSLILCIITSCLTQFQLVASAAAMTIVDSKGNVVGEGGSIHYKGNNATFTVNLSLSGFNLYIGGSFYSYTENSSMTVTITDPQPGTIIMADHNGDKASITINFYKDTDISEGSTLSYQSIKMRVDSVDGQTVDSLIVDYDGYNNTGVDVAQLRSKIPLSEGTHNISGEIMVRVFKNGNPSGDYWTSDYSLYIDFSWGSIEDELRQRQNWATTINLEPPIPVISDNNNQILPSTQVVIRSNGVPIILKGDQSWFPSYAIHKYYWWSYKKSTDDNSSYIDIAKGEDKKEITITLPAGTYIFRLGVHYD